MYSYRRPFPGDVVEFKVYEGRMEELVNGRWFLAAWKNDAVWVASTVIDELSNGRGLACFRNERLGRNVCPAKFVEDLR